MTATQTSAQTLDPLRFPLSGSRLIEASAGTGKTWTIAALYLRLVLGHGPQGSAYPGGPLRPEQILVMTFTRAATRELADRIRARLLEAAEVFRASLPGEPAPDSGHEFAPNLSPSEAGPGAANLPATTQPDALLLDLLAAFPEAESRQSAAWRLAQAAEWMDEAAIHTIDAWCQRMLREHAFDSGSLFDEELLADEAELQTQAGLDYWRQQVYPLDPAGLQQVLRFWPDAGAMQADVRELLKVPLPAGAGQGHLQALVERQLGAEASAVEGAAEQVAAMRSWLTAQLNNFPKHWNGTKLKAATAIGWLDELSEWAASPVGRELPGGKSKLRSRLTPDGLIDARTKAAPPMDAQRDIPACFAWFEATVAALEALPSARPALRLHAAALISQRLEALKRQSGHFGFADLQARLEKALAGPGGPALRERLLRQTPVALIDEFQDTSSLQFRLFDRLFLVTPGAQTEAQTHPQTQTHPDPPLPPTALLLIGDPKQSIYRFRGADIDAYLATRRATAGRHYMLGTNFRSSQALVAAVNQLFEKADKACVTGAFDYRAAAGESQPTQALPPDDPLPFVPVGAKGRPERFVTDGQPAAALELAWWPELENADASRQRFAEQAAAQVLAWLNNPRTGFAQPAEEADGAELFRRLRPADIAILVRNGKEARAVRRALARRRLASVYLSDRESVLASDEARDLLLWLRAVAEPQDARQVRAALATATVGLSIEELAWLATDDEAFEARSEQLRDLQRIWRSQGVLPLLRHSLHALQLPARWLAEPDGERKLTNYLHLAELLQAAEREREGEAALIRWLSDMLQAPGGAADEQIVRLESDADLVKIVTVHKSKGLEYPLVLLPFATHFRAATRGRGAFIQRPDEHGQPQLELELDDEALAWAERERLREDLRLLYVALTRARHALWVGVAVLGRNTKDGPKLNTHSSALGRLLLGDGEASISTLNQAMLALQSPEAEQAAACATGTVLRQLPDEAPFETLAPREAPPPLVAAPTFPPEGATMFDRQWGVSSFSALVRALNAPVAPTNSRLADDLPPTGLEAIAAPGPVQASSQRLTDDEPELPTGEAGLIIGTVTGADASTGLAVWHSFERGALAGNFLHEQLEWLAAERFALPQVASQPELASGLPADDDSARSGDVPSAASASAGRSELEEPSATHPLVERFRRRCERAGRGNQAPAIIDWLRNVVHHPLSGPGVPLSQLERCLPEMEWWLPTQSLPGDELDALCRQHLLPGLERPPLPQRHPHGLVMGFADLVIEHQGRWWVLDYKSNQLGPDPQAYTAEALAQAVAEHRYDVQAALYLLALHRLLSQRLGTAYQPEQHLGGALFFFLRGLDGPSGGVLHLPASAELLAGLDRWFQPPGTRTDSPATTEVSP